MRIFPNTLNIKQKAADLVKFKDLGPQISRMLKTKDSVKNTIINSKLPSKVEAKLINSLITEITQLKIKAENNINYARKTWIQSETKMKNLAREILHGDKLTNKDRAKLDKDMGNQLKMQIHCLNFKSANKAYKEKLEKALLDFIPETDETKSQDAEFPTTAYQPNTNIEQTSQLVIKAVNQNVQDFKLSNHHLFLVLFVLMIFGIVL